MGAKSDVQRALQFDDAEYRLWIAVHEMGHAVLGIAGGHRISSVRISSTPDGAAGGVTRLSRWGRRDRYNVIVQLYGGYLAAERWLTDTGRGRRDRYEISRASSRRDLDHVARLGESQTEIEKAAGESRKLLDQHWKKLLRGADLLADRGSLTGRDLRRL